MTKEQWKQIEDDFKEWDEKGKFNASQRNILDWFKPIIEDLIKQTQVGVFGDGYESGYNQAKKDRDKQLLWRTKT